MSKRNIWLDIFKLFLCFLVICIHYVRQMYDHFPIYRMAVPTFFLISGYFMFIKAPEDNETKALSFVRRSLIYMLIGLGLHFVFDFFLTFRSDGSLSDFFETQIYNDFFRNFVFYNYPLSKTGSHLWYLIALFIVSIIHYLLVKLKLLKTYPIIIIFSLTIHFIFSGYIPDVVDEAVSLFYIRNAFFMGLPLFGLGYLMAKVNFHPNLWIKYMYLGLGIFFFFFQIVDADGMILEMYPSSILAGVFLLQFFLSLKPIKSDWYYKWFGKNLPFYIYALHKIVGYVLTENFNINNSYPKAVLVFIISFALYEIVFLGVKCFTYIKNKC